MNGVGKHGKYIIDILKNKLSPKELKEELKKNAEELFKLIDEGKELEKKVKNILEKEMK